jgi:hypothetical protein
MGGVIGCEFGNAKKNRSDDEGTNEETKSRFARRDGDG